MPVPELYREPGMSSAIYYKWRAKYGGMGSSMIARFKEFEAEKARLKKMYVEEQIKVESLKRRLIKQLCSIKSASDIDLQVQGGFK